MAKRIDGNVSRSKLVPEDTNSGYGIINANDATGGPFTKATLAERDAIKPGLLTIGATCYVEATGITYVVTDGTVTPDGVTNPQWADTLAPAARTNLANVLTESVDSRLIAPASVNGEKVAPASISLLHLDPAVRSTIGSGFDPDKAQDPWNAATNTPAIPAAAPENSGWWYYVGVPGTHAGGNAPAGDYIKGDRLRSNGTAWQRFPLADTSISDGSIDNPKLKDILIRPDTLITVAPGVKKRAVLGWKTKKPGGGNAALLFQDDTGKLWPSQTAGVEAALAALAAATGTSIATLTAQFAGITAPGGLPISSVAGWRVVTGKGVRINGVWEPLAWCIATDNFTKALFGATQSGKWFPPPPVIPTPEPVEGGYSAPDCVVQPVAGGLRALSSAGESVIIDDGRTYTAVQHRNGSRWLAAVAGALCLVSVSERAVIPQLSLDMMPNVIQHFGWTGQSLALGTGAGPLLSTVAQYPAHSLMFGAGSQAGAANAPLDGAALTSFVPLVEVSNPVSNAFESPLSGMANRLISKTESAFGVKPVILQSNHAYGGARISLIEKGTIPYDNALVEFQRAHAIAVALGKGHVVPAIIMEHGQADEKYSTGAVTYEARLRQLRADYDADVKTITGQLEDLYILINQNSSWSHYAKITPGAAIAQWLAALHDPFIICYGPEYHLPFSADGVHLRGAASYRTGEYAAKAWFYTKHRGKKFQPLQPVSVSQTADEVAVVMNNEYPLAWDTTIVSAIAHYGFELTGATITGTPVIDGNTIRIPKSGTATAVAYAHTAVLDPPGEETDGGPLTGPRGNLRQSNPEVSLRDGFPLYDWTVHFILPL